MWRNGTHGPGAAVADKEDEMKEDKICREAKRKIAQLSLKLYAASGILGVAGGALLGGEDGRIQSDSAGGCDMDCSNSVVCDFQYDHEQQRNLL